MGRRKRTHLGFSDEIEAINDQSIKDYLYRLKKIATSIFEWTDLPDSMDARFLEECLFFNGKAAFLKDEEYGFINTQCADGGYVNIYRLPTQLNCFSVGYNVIRNVYNGLSTKDPDENTQAVLVMNNADRVPTSSTLELYAYRLYQAERASDVNISLQKFPLLIMTRENQRLTMENFYKQYESNTPFIFGDKALDLSQTKVLQTEAPYVADKLQNYKESIWSEALNFLGVTASFEKKERMITSEINQNNEEINFNLQSYLIPRQKACEQFNEKYNLNIGVKVRSDIDNVIKNELSTVKDLVGDQPTEEEFENV